MAQRGAYPRARTARPACSLAPTTPCASLAPPFRALANTDVGGLQIDALGNPNLRPERSTEFEGGFETKLFNSRASLDITYYNKRTKDALISAIVAPSAGSAANVRQNLGAVRNRGWEFLGSAQVLDRRLCRYGHVGQLFHEQQRTDFVRWYTAADRHEHPRGRGLSPLRLLGKQDPRLAGQERRRAADVLPRRSSQ